MVDIKQNESDINLAIRLSRGRTVGGQKITEGLLCNPEAVQQLVRNEQAYKFLKKCERFSCILAERVIWCLGNALQVRYPNLVSHFVSSRFAMARNSASCCQTVWEAIVTR